MPTPPLTIQHLKTSKQYEGAQLINRYWFQWQNRRNLLFLTVRFDLLDDAGNVLTTASVLLPKTKVTGYTGNGQDDSARQPKYDTPVFIKIDDVATHQATQFRYYVVTGILSKSEVVLAPMQGVFEDLSRHG